MRMTAQARLYLPGEEVFRKPSFWDKTRTFFGADVDLRTGELQVTQNVLGLTERVQQGLSLAGITNAVSLVVDTDVVFQDHAGQANDAHLLVEALRRAHERFTAGFQVLRLVFEHEADGLHVLHEVTIRAKHGKTEPTATVAVGARIEELRPKDGEDLEAAKDRIGKALGNAALVPTYRNLLNQQVQRVVQGLQRAFPTARVEVDAADVQIVRPSSGELRDLGQFGHDARDPDLRDNPAYPRAGYYGPYYDPWRTYYHDPMDTFVNLMVLDALLHPRPYWGYGPGYLGSHWSSYGAPVQVINYNGAPIASADQIDSVAGQLGGVHDVANVDWGSATWDDRTLTGYDAASSSWDQHHSGGAATGSAWDCAGYDSGTSSWDCAAEPAASADCAWDCNADCSWDCSSDCSWDCSSDCGGDW